MVTPHPATVGGVKFNLGKMEGVQTSFITHYSYQK